MQHRKSETPGARVRQIAITIAAQDFAQALVPGDQERLLMPLFHCISDFLFLAKDLPYASSGVAPAK